MSLMNHTPMFDDYLDLPMISQRFLYRWLSTVETTTPETWCTWQPYNAHLTVRRKNISQMEKRCANICIFEKQMRMTLVLVGGKRPCFGLGWPSKIEVIGAPSICTIYSICIRKTLEYAFRFLNVSWSNESTVFVIQTHIKTNTFLNWARGQTNG